MPEHLVPALKAFPSTLPSAKQVGSHYLPLVNETKDGIVHAHAVQTILVEPQALYDLWRDIESAPIWQEYIVSVTAKDATLSHWVAGNPEDADGKRIEWDSEITEDVRGEKFAWHSITEGIDESGVVTFVPHISGRGTVVTLIETAKLPGGALTSAIAAVAKRGPHQIVIEDLRHFKEIAEAGEIPSVKGQPHGPRGISGKVKEWMYGETNPTPAGTSESA